MVPAALIAEIMGGTMVLGTQVSSVGELARVVSGGLPKQALRRTVQRLYHVPQEVNSLVYRIVPEATYKRRIRLTPSESERTERLARVIAAAEYVWDDKEQAHEWLAKPHAELNGATPLQFAMTELGARQVEQLLDRLFYGLPV
jgi:putative toxin-antitoxin system antitoxin component (TIGR02293 family)